ncbi:M20/M25/M40 family metallo-hydrolase [Paraconexibacter antarcticus]|uniref:M20/M25/M40 family metallo-hydrolase n=1 Tax=Paraconexibacter antarcticus TaxID=2949664 RepID=A0ABY5DP10_9ACTN|nr:M20/M25/M40 family metallo-hydrolase [Paraconexibacter antarcticus]UTI62923.1 M20/M25/M40 family metallo-hydrolase [Paraconexibacter antarcticus]
MPAGGAAGGGTGAALAALDRHRLLAGLQQLVRTPSVTGEERAVLEVAAAQARAAGLHDVVLREYDLAGLRADPEHPGEEAPRTALWNLRARLPGATPGAPVLVLCAHLDVVAPGTVPWPHGSPWSGVVEDGLLHGRGSADMKGGFAAALAALAAVRAAGAVPACAVELLAVSSEEDGGLGAFAALREDDRYAACVIPEPTGFDVVCAQAGAITFTGVVHGVAAHAAHRLEGASAIDRYLPVHAALQALEAEVNAGVAHPLMRALELPYPVSVGRVAAGDWSSSVPDRLEFEGRAPVVVGETVAQARGRVEAAVAGAGAGHVELRWTGGSFGSAETAPDHPLAVLVQRAARAHGTGAQPGRLAGVPWGADMRLFTARGIPTVMCGTAGIRVAHGVDEHVPVADVEALARVFVEVICGFGA